VKRARAAGVRTALRVRAGRPWVESDRALLTPAELASGGRWQCPTGHQGIEEGEAGWGVRLCGEPCDRDGEVASSGIADASEPALAVKRCEDGCIVVPWTDSDPHVEAAREDLLDAVDVRAPDTYLEDPVGDDLRGSRFCDRELHRGTRS